MYTVNLTLSSFYFGVLLLVSMSWGDLMVSPCLKVRNITLIPIVAIKDEYDRDSDYVYFLRKDTQLTFLVKSILDKPCFMFWAFSPIQSRLIRLTEENYRAFFDTDFQAITRTDGREMMNVLENMPHTNNTSKQTIFFLVDRYGYSSKSLEKDLSLEKHISTVIKKAQRMWERKESDFVVLNVNYEADQLSIPWIRNENFISDTYGSRKFDPHLHQILMDQMLNPRYDWRERYTRHLKVQCISSKKHHFYLWMNFSWYYPDYEFWNTIVRDVLPNVTFHSIITVTDTMVLRKGYTRKDKLMKYLKEEEEENDEIVVIYLPFSRGRVDHTYFYPMKFNDENAINIILRDTFEDSPVLQNGNIVVNDDYRNPLFFKLVFEKINSILCRKNKSP
uniref:Uncharacterized protein n=1 Tax=Clytia hemisphaerica TaxID=252671 RepID=A0A7M5X158_9CNID